MASIASATTTKTQQRRMTHALVFVLVLLLAHMPSTTHAGCCDVCLSQTDPAHDVITYDPLVHDQCSKIRGICCYNCGFSHGSATFSDGVTFDATTGAPRATAGTRIRFTFNNVARVTFDALRINQKRTTFVGNRSLEAEKSTTGEFSLCVNTAGMIALRGWGADSCSQVTPELTIQVADALDGATCAASLPVGTVKPADTTPSSSSTQPVDSLGNSTTTTVQPTGKFDTVNCNLNRGSIVTSDDKTKVCECAGDWRQPPACDQYSWTKTILTIAGAIATVLSIVISVRAYLNSRKAKAAAAAAAHDLDLDDRISEEVLRIDARSPLKTTSSSSMRPSSSSTTAAATTTRSPPRTTASRPSTTTTPVLTTMNAREMTL